MNLHFGTNPADIWIRIKINPEIWIWILDRFWLTFQWSLRSLLLLYVYDISAGARLSATQKEMPRSRSSEFNDELHTEDRYIQVTLFQILKCLLLLLHLLTRCLIF